MQERMHGLWSLKGEGMDGFDSIEFKTYIHESPSKYSAMNMAS